MGAAAHLGIESSDYDKLIATLIPAGGRVLRAARV